MNMVKRHSYWVTALLMVLAVSGLCYYCYKPQPSAISSEAAPSKKPSKIITVFIHGSLYPDDTFLETISLSDLNTIVFDTIDDESEYMKSLKRVRTNTAMYEDQIMLAEGLHKIEETAFSHLCDKVNGDVHRNTGGCHHCGSCGHAHTANKQPMYGAYYAVAGYHSLMKHFFTKDDASYYTFGHLGVLSHRYRANTAQTLYHGLLKIVQEARCAYEKVTIVLVAHSHGGSIALNMARAEDEHKKGLIVDDLILLGTPLHCETAPYAYHSMFKRVLNCYSLGDTIQGSDVLTTISRKCYKTFAAFDAAAFSKGTVYDVQLTLNDDSNSITHCNMWYMQRDGKKACHLEPLPYAVMIPALLAGLNAQSLHNNTVRASIRSNEAYLSMQVDDMKNESNEHHASSNTYNILAQLRDRIPAQKVQGVA